jgi:hypothetical protein
MPFFASGAIGIPTDLLLTSDDFVLECRSSVLNTGKGVGLCIKLLSSSPMDRFLPDETFDGLFPNVEEDGTKGS